MLIEKIFRLIVLSVIFCGCDDKNKGVNVRFNDKSDINDVIMYGDSLCARPYSTPHIMGIKKDCVSGRKLIDLKEIDYNNRIIFLALGINDIGRGVTSEDYNNKLIELVRDNVICIMPNDHPTIDSSEYRDSIEGVCSRFIDPVYDCAVSIGDSDGVHYIEQDYQSLASCLSIMI